MNYDPFQYLYEELMPEHQPCLNRLSNLMGKTTGIICTGFTRMMTQEFLVLRRQAESRDDEITMKSMDATLAGLKDLSRVVDVYENTRLGKPLRFPVSAFTIFINLAKYPNEFLPHRRAGEHYLYVWNLPQAARSHFGRALQLSGLGTDASLAN